MAERGAAHETLRTTTRDEHEALDALFARFDLTDRDRYRDFLVAHAMALPAVEAALDASEFATELPDWPERRRTDAIGADLAALGAAMPAPLPFAALGSAARSWGAAYVLEGSRLGGAFLARQLGEAFLRAYLGTAQPAGRWRAFLAELDAALASSEDRAEAAATARTVFALFAEAGRKMEPN